jgi:hypothetical protein
MTAHAAFFGLVLALFVTTTAQARLGESEAQLIQRFGKPILHQHFTWCDKENFNPNGFSIEVTLLGGQSVGEVYHITIGTFTEEQILELLQDNSQGYDWDEVSKSNMPQDIYHSIRHMWQRPNGSTAILRGNAFEFKSIYLIMAEEAANKPPPAPSTAGF